MSRLWLFAIPLVLGAAPARAQGVILREAPAVIEESAPYVAKMAPWLGKMLPKVAPKAAEFGLGVGAGWTANQLPNWRDPVTRANPSPGLPRGPTLIAPGQTGQIGLGSAETWYLKPDWRSRKLVGPSAPDLGSALRNGNPSTPNLSGSLASHLEQLQSSRPILPIRPSPLPPPQPR
jgi:hypothetical protein